MTGRRGGSAARERLDRIKLAKAEWQLAEAEAQKARERGDPVELVRDLASTCKRLCEAYCLACGKAGDALVLIADRVLEGKNTRIGVRALAEVKL